MTKKPRTSFCFLFQPLPTAAALVFLFLPASSAFAQAPAGGTGAPATTGPGSNAPGATGPAPGVSSGISRSVPNKPLSLSDVVSIAVGTNSGLVLAQQRLQQARELIVQVNAQGRPQFSADAVDVYSSYRAFPPTLTNPVVSNPVLPGGGQIPQVVDSGTGFSTAFIGGGGGGNAPSTGSSSSVGLSASPSSSSSVSPGSVTTPGTSAPGSLSAPSPVSPGGTAPASPAAPTVVTPNGPAAPPVSPGASVPGTTAPGNAAPSNTAPGNAAPGNTAPGTAAPAATGSAVLDPALPAILAGYIAAPLPAATPILAASPSALRTGAAEAKEADLKEAASKEADTEAADAKPRDTGTGTGTSTGTGTGAAVAPSVAAGGKINNAAARVSVAQYLDVFGLLSAARGAQNDVRDFYTFDIQRLQNETALAAKNLFFNLLLTQSQLATQEEQVRFAEENVRITQNRLSQGIVSRFDVLTAQTALSTAQQILISAQDSRDLAQADLSYLLGTDPDVPLALVTPPLPPLTQTVDLRQSTQTALTRRPEIRQANANIEESRRLVRLAGSTLLPTISLVASGNQTTTASITSPKSFATVTAQVSLPLDDGGATRSRVRSARLDVQTQQITLAELQSNVSLEVRQAVLNIRNGQAQVGAAQTGVAQAQEAVRLAYLRYQGGLGTFLDILNALAQLAATRNNLSSAEFFYQVSLAQLVRSLGGR